MNNFINNLEGIIGWIQTPVLGFLGIVIVLCGYLFIFKQKDSAKSWLIVALIGFVLVKTGLSLVKSLSSVIK